MALGPDHFNLTVSLGSVFCFQGDDIDDVFDEESEPYLWTFMVKIDGEGLRQQGNVLVGDPVCFFGPGSHGNLGGSILRGTRQIPPAVGTWSTSLQPIPISVGDVRVTEIPGTILLAAVLMEENLTPDDAVEQAHQTVIDLIRSTLASTLASLGLAGLAADALADIATDAGNGITTTPATAAQRVLQRRLKPIQDLFSVAAPASATVTILQNLGIGGAIGSAIDADKPMGTFVQTFGQADLAATFDSAWGMPSGHRISFDPHLWNMPEWAYSLHGQAWAHHSYVRRGHPATQRLQVTCTSKGIKRLGAIGGVDNGTFWQFYRGEAAAAIRSGQHSFFVRGARGEEVEVVAQQGGFWNGQPWYYVQTIADGDLSDNLMKLPDCPAGGDVDEVWY